MESRSRRAARAGLAALCLFCWSAAQAKAPAEAAPEQPRVAAVSGRGEVSAAPDRARLSMSVEVTKPELKAAQAEANRITREYLAQARSLGAKDEDISTAGLSIRAEYDYSGKVPGSRKFIGYHVSRNIEVVVRDLDRIGDYLMRATDAGVNAVSDPQLESSRADELRRQALAKAAEDAQANARVLAEALGARLGAVRTVSSGVDVTPPPRPRLMVMAAEAHQDQSGNEEMGFAAGSIRFSASVSAQFDLVVP